VPGRRRDPAPFWWDARQSYYLQVGKKQIKLGPDLDEANRLAHKILAERPEEPKPVVASEMLVAEVCDEFLVWAEANKAPLTYKAYVRRLQHFLDSLKEHGDQYLPVAALRPYHVTRAANEKGVGWASTSKNDLVGACQRAFNWAKRQGLVDSNPLTGMEKPPREDRELAISPAQYEEVLAAVREPTFGELLRFAWESGVRPQEIINIHARYVDFDQRRIVFPIREPKRRRSHRVVYLTPESEAILRPLVAAHPTGPVFHNSAGRPWKKDAINCAFCRLQKRLGRKLYLGAFRKGFATEALKNGLDTVTVSALMGHANAVMVSRVYAKVQQDPKFMAEAAKRAKGQQR
jgi:integrase